jgi:uncharacterized protein (DUF2461 family)
MKTHLFKSFISSLVIILIASVAATAVLHDDLRLKSWAVSRSFPQRFARSPELVEAIAELALSCAELLEFGWTALETT